MLGGTFNAFFALPRSFLVRLSVLHSLVLDFGSNHETANIWIPTNQKWMCVGSGGFASCFEPFEAIDVDYRGKDLLLETRITIDLTLRLLVMLLLTLSLKTLVLRLIKESLHDGFFKFDWIVDFKGILTLPRNDIVEAVPDTLFQDHV